MGKREIGKRIYDIAIEFKPTYTEGFTYDEIGELMTLIESNVKEFDSEQFFNVHLSSDVITMNDDRGFRIIRDRTDILKAMINAIKEPKKPKLKK